MKMPKILDTNVVLLWIANFNVKKMIKQPVNRLITVEHQDKLHNKRQLIRLEQFT